MMRIPSAVRARWTLVAAGTIGTVALMALVTATMPRRFSAWAVVDTGTLGRERGFGEVVNAFNTGTYMAFVEPADAGKVSKATMVDARPKVLIRVDALDGPTAARAADRFAEYAITELSKLPINPTGADAPAPPATVNEIRRQIEDFDKAVSAMIAVAIDAQVKTAIDRDASFAEMRRLASGNAPASADMWRGLAKRSFAAIDSLTGQGEEIVNLNAAHAVLTSALPAPVSNAMVPELRKLLIGNVSSSAAIRARANAIRDVLAHPVDPALPMTRAFIERHAEVPVSHSWPRAAVNLPIAFLFGLAGSILISIFLQPVHPDE